MMIVNSAERVSVKPRREKDHLRRESGGGFFRCQAPRAEATEPDLWKEERLNVWQLSIRVILYNIFCKVLDCVCHITVANTAFAFVVLEVIDSARTTYLSRFSIVGTGKVDSTFRPKEAY